MDSGSGMHHGMMAPPSNGSNTTTNGTMHHKMMMHMTFYWGKDALILFRGWPGTSAGMYVLALIFVFILAVLIEWLSHSRFLRNDSGNLSAGIKQTLLHTVRVALAYLVMLAVMSFNFGVFLVAVAGHAVGFLVFGSRVFKRDHGSEFGRKQTDLPPSTC